MRITKEKAVLAGIIFTAFLIRIIYLFQLVKTPLFGFFAADSAAYDQFASQILKGSFFFKDSVYLHPLYPAFLSLIYFIFGHFLQAVILIQAVLDTFSVLLIYLLAVRVFQDKRVGLAAAFIYSFYGIAVFYTGFLLEATLATFFTCYLIFLILRASEKNKGHIWIYAGVIFASASLLRSNTGLILPLVIAWIFYQYRGPGRLGHKVRIISFFLLGAFIIFAPFSYRNYILDKRITPFSVHGGYNFYIGNNPGSTGAYTASEGVANSGLEQVKDSVNKASRITGKRLSASEASGYWMREAVTFIMGNKWLALKLFFKKILLFWNSAEVSHNLDYYFCRQFLPLLKLPLFSFGIIAPFAILGVIIGFKSRLRESNFLAIFLAIYTLSVAAFFISDRFRLPVVPLMILFASFAFFRLYDLFRSLGDDRSLLRILFYILSLALLFMLVYRDLGAINPKYSLAVSLNNLGVGYYEAGRPDLAALEYQKALQYNPDYARARNNLGSAYYKLGLFDEAIKQYLTAVSLDPRSPDAYNNLGNVYLRIGLIDRAIAQYNSAKSLNPGLAETFYNSGNAYYQKGLAEEAISEYKKAIELDPEHARAHNNLGNIFYQRGMLDEAAVEYYSAQKIDPGMANVYANLGNIYMQQGKIDDAIKEFNNALKLKHQDPGRIYFLLGSSYYLKKDYKRALNFFTQAQNKGIIIDSAVMEKLTQLSQ